VYHEGIVRKGANNVASLIIKSLIDLGIMRENDIGGELVIVFDNCSGQNKNNTVLKMMAWLVEMGYFKKVQFLFLIAGHTKNAADCLFNMLKAAYCKQNLFTIPQLLDALSKSRTVNVIEAKEEYFFDYDTWFNLYYSNFSGMVKQNHIFTCDISTARQGNQFMAEMRESYLDEHKTTATNTWKQNFPGRWDVKLYSEAVLNRATLIRYNQPTLLPMVWAAEINICKQVELSTNYKPVIPQQHHEDIIYKDPPQVIKDAVRDEKAKRAAFKQELNKSKSKAAKEALKKELDDVHLGNDPMKEDTPEQKAPPKGQKKRATTKAREEKAPPKKKTAGQKKKAPSKKKGAPVEMTTAVASKSDAMDDGGTKGDIKYD
jgi:hypothetical protein